MPISPEELRRFRPAIEAALATNTLDAWQRQFLSDMQAKIVRYGDRTRLSHKQEAKLRQLVQPYLNRPPSSIRQPLTRQLSRRRSAVVRTLRPKFRRRSGFWRAWRRTSINKKIDFIVLAIAGLLFVGSQVRDFSWRHASTPTSYGARILALADFAVVDGDTIHLKGRSKGTRLVGFNTPETFEPRCEAGLQLGKRATRRLKELVATAQAIELTLVACACAQGTEGTSHCNYGRSCGVLRVDGRDVGDILVSEGLAARFSCGATSCPPTPRPWCGQ